MPTGGQQSVPLGDSHPVYTQYHWGETCQSSQHTIGHTLKPNVLDPMGSQWDIGKSQGRPVCLILEALGSGPDYVDTGDRCP